MQPEKVIVIRRLDVGGRQFQISAALNSTAFSNKDNFKNKYKYYHCPLKTCMD